MTNKLREPVAWRGKTRTPEERFWSKVNRDGGPDACWKWHSTRTRKGYGMFTVDHKHMLAHRVSWMLANGEIPEGLDMLHGCDFPSCVNPAHLRPGTHAENIRDAVERGQLRGDQGEENFFAKLTEGDVLMIRAKYSGGMFQSEIAREFGIRQTNVSMIVTRQTWKHI